MTAYGIVTITSGGVGVRCFYAGSCRRLRRYNGWDISAWALLRQGARDLPARQRTLRDTIAWSHSLLSADAKLLFARLAVFAGSVDLEAMEQVTNSEDRLDILDLIAELVDQSLVQALGEAAEPRFGMLETIGEFAAGRGDGSFWSTRG